MNNLFSDVDQDPKNTEGKEGHHDEKKEGLDLKNRNEREGEVNEDEDRDDEDFDDWRGVKRPGEKTTTDEDIDDDDDGPDGGVMMPIPDVVPPV